MRQQQCLCFKLKKFVAACLLIEAKVLELSALFQSMDSVGGTWRTGRIFNLHFFILHVFYVGMVSLI